MPRPAVPPRLRLSGASPAIELRAAFREGDHQHEDVSHPFNGQHFLGEEVALPETGGVTFSPFLGPSGTLDFFRSNILRRELGSMGRKHFTEEQIAFALRHAAPGTRPR